MAVYLAVKFYSGSRGREAWWLAGPFPSIRLPIYLKENETKWDETRRALPSVTHLASKLPSRFTGNSPSPSFFPRLSFSSLYYLLSFSAFHSFYSCLSLYFLSLSLSPYFSPSLGYPYPLSPLVFISPLSGASSTVCVRVHDVSLSVASILVGAVWVLFIESTTYI